MVLHLVLFLDAGFALAELPVFVASSGYDLGNFGNYPIQTFKSSKAIAPRPNLLRQDSSCARSSKIVFAPRALVRAPPSLQATIMDAHGHLVWTSGWDDMYIYNLMVQKYEDHNYLTFWAGPKPAGGRGAGAYYVLDETYNLTAKFEAAHGLQGDLHEFRFTDRGTVLLTAYDIKDHDLSSLGKTIGPIWDCLLQEVDIRTGDLLFEWRASDHISISDTYTAIGDTGDPGGAPFDWLHINSVDKDAKGNYLVSCRFLHALAYVQGRTGNVVWVLGGKNNMFSDLSAGRATGFAMQHDARWDSDYSEITLFNNGANDSEARGMRIAVDQTAMTAKLVTEYESPHHIRSATQGSMQNLPGGNVLLSFGRSAAFTEFSRHGKVLCDTHFGPEYRFNSGEVQSYRVLKYDWKGYPTTNPDLAVVQDDAMIWRAYVSWNGATEVTEWVLQGTDSDLSGSEWRVVGTKLRDGFETDFLLGADHPRHLRAVGLDHKGNALGTSMPVNV
ncbi:arylsulfotransferase (ASST) domain-containing protein [Hirsutella rhossiliensis]|uniref:Arylsulfotransferase (ASST) domain-containing protein n=1 Tax=Hirsutella rhossiliensis TaxID=111463 RepID=A0A9P8N6D4_9HYPO|nr:arylsulfotransferase (ASST) domain-containing protein [Hirsutella rhossiliensis]KAH0968473.1 arylsulfotransferase (ASST) domain-containing protein [Hirsutella rhossiliensis]